MDEAPWAPSHCPSHLGLGLGDQQGLLLLGGREGEDPGATGALTNQFGAPALALRGGTKSGHSLAGLPFRIPERLPGLTLDGGKQTRA